MKIFFWRKILSKIGSCINGIVRILFVLFLNVSGLNLLPYNGEMSKTVDMLPKRRYIRIYFELLSKRVTPFEKKTEFSNLNYTDSGQV